MKNGVRILVCVVNYLIKPVENEEFNAKCKKGHPKYGKAQGKQGFAKGETHRRKTLEILKESMHCEYRVVLQNTLDRERHRKSIGEA